MVYSTSSGRFRYDHGRYACDGAMLCLTWVLTVWLYVGKWSFLVICIDVFVPGAIIL